MDNQPSFADRAQLLKETAHQLKVAAETVLSEAQRMQAAQQRFSERLRNRPAARQIKR
jgi:anion-transporting  ArsA/GET3 family ATPase